MYSEADTRSKFIDPKLYAQGWEEEYIVRERSFTDGRKLPGGKRSAPLFLDYLLKMYGLNLAIIEAKKYGLPVTEGFDMFLKNNKKEALLIEQVTTKIKAFAKVLQLQIKNYVDEEKVVNPASLKKEKKVLMTFINQHIEEFKILYIFFVFSMLWLDLDESSKENLLKSRFMDSFDISVYIELLDELFTEIIGRINY